tara:strand:- start:7291 stop:9477 length:2187 start_codon:yes stop_codon:yes gene_type:complete
MSLKQTQNQFFGKLSDLPSRMPMGSEYKVIDDDNVSIYMYGQNEKPVLISPVGGEDVPYEGASRDLDLGVYGLIAQRVQISGGTGTEGTLSWNADESTMDLQSGGVTYQLGQEIAPLVRNNTGATITNGTPVMFSGTLGASGRILVTPAIADGTIPSSYILGLTTENILSGEDGHATWFGKVRGINTTGAPYGQVWSAGDLIYVSEVTAGWLTNVKPEAPNLQISVAAVVNAHPQQGSLFIRPSWRGNLVDLDDVNGTPLTVTGQILVWDKERGVFDFTSNINDYALLTSQVIVTQSNIQTTLGGVIDSTKQYFIDGVIDMGATQITVPPNGIEIKGYSFNNSGLYSAQDNYTMFVSESIAIGSGDLLGVDLYIAVVGVNSKVFELYDSNGFHGIEMNRVNYNDCTSLGDVYDYRQGLELGTGRFGGSPSLTLHGLWRGGFRISTSISRSMSDTTTEPMFKAGTLFQMDSRFITDMNVDLGTLQPLLDFAPANFPNPKTLQLKGMIVSRDFVFNKLDANLTPNITELDTASEWLSNDGIPNSPTFQVKTYQFELNNFQRGNLAPVAVEIGTAPVINGFLLDNIDSKMAFNFMIPLDWDFETDMQLMAMVAIPAGVTATVGDKIQMKVEHRVTRQFAVTKADAAGVVHDTDQPQGTAPFGDINDNVILTGKNTEYYTYMPHVILPASTIGEIGGVLSGEISLQDLGVGNVDSIVLYQLHLNYKGFNLNI